MRYKVLKFWVELDRNHQFTPTVDFLKLIVIFAYFRYPITILQCLKKIIEVDHKIQDCIIFGQIGLGQLFWEGD